MAAVSPAQPVPTMTTFSTEEDMSEGLDVFLDSSLPRAESAECGIAIGKKQQVGRRLWNHDLVQPQHSTVGKWKVVTKQLRTRAPRQAATRPGTTGGERVSR